MLKRIRDFIYDINDIFVALVIVLIAAGVIIWRSASIMDYPSYVAKHANSGSNTSINFDPAGSNTTNTVPQTNTATNTVEPQTNTADPQQGATNTVTPPANTVDPNTNTADPNTNTVQPNQPDANGVVKGTITIEPGAKGGWSAIADKIIAIGVFKDSDKKDFVAKVNELGLASRAQPGTFELSSDMSFEQMVRIICKMK